jgi:hypothetical protein
VSLLRPGIAGSQALRLVPEGGAVDLTGLEDAALSWHVPPPVRAIRGLRLVADAPRPARLSLAVARAIVRANHRIGALDALRLATAALETARRERLEPVFFCSTILQESGFSPTAVSSAGAFGIAQFTLSTADAYGVDPFDWRSALRGSARLLAKYVRRYDGRFADPYAAALAAYNAGPIAVERYGGVPPYPETRGYISDIYERWGRILRETRNRPLIAKPPRGAAHGHRRHLDLPGGVDKPSDREGHVSSSVHRRN